MHRSLKREEPWGTYEVIPEAKWFHMIYTVEDFDTVDSMVIIFVVHKNSLLNCNNLCWIANINKTEDMVWKIYVPQRIKRTF